MLKKNLCLVVAVVIFSSVFGGCDRDHTETVGSGDMIEWATVSDSSELPDWTGKKLKIAYWDAEGNSSTKRDNLAQNDVVTPEVFRVTGVMYDPETSIDNGGQGNMEAKLGKISAVNDYPAVVERADRSIMKRLAEADLIYDLTELIPKYCPNILAEIPNDIFDDVWADQTVSQNGKIYGIPVSFKQSNLARVINQETVTDKNALVQFGISPNPSRGSIFVRDDILKMIYPEAKSKAELKELFMQRGGEFLEEDYRDVVISSVDEFFELLRKIRSLGIKENGRDVYPMYTHTGGDNWELLAQLSGVLYGYSFSTLGNNYFTYFDKQTQRLEFTFKQPWFKEVLRNWNKLVREDVLSQESLIENSTLFNEKMNNGLYAITSIETRCPSDAVLEQNGKPFRYRKVVLDIPPDYNKFVFAQTMAMNSGGRSALIFKSSVKEEDLPQILRFYDFMYSEAGRKLAVWGAKSAGLFTEDDGERQYKDKELADCIINGVTNELDVKYGLINRAWPGYPYNLSNPYHPLLTSKEKVALEPSMVNMFYNYGFIEPLHQVKSYDWYINNFTGDVPSVKKFWDSRASFETALKRVFTADSESSFEDLYSQLIDLAETNGATEQTLLEMNDKFKQLNVQNMENLK